MEAAQIRLYNHRQGTAAALEQQRTRMSTTAAEAQAAALNVAAVVVKDEVVEVEEMGGGGGGGSDAGAGGGSARVVVKLEASTTQAMHNDDGGVDHGSGGGGGGGGSTGVTVKSESADVGPQVSHVDRGDGGGGDEAGDNGDSCSGHRGGPMETGQAITSSPALNASAGQSEPDDTSSDLPTHELDDGDVSLIEPDAGGDGVRRSNRGKRQPVKLKLVKREIGLLRCPRCEGVVNAATELGCNIVTCKNLHQETLASEQGRRVHSRGEWCYFCFHCGVENNGEACPSNWCPHRVNRAARVEAVRRRNEYDAKFPIELE